MNGWRLWKMGFIITLTWLWFSSNPVLCDPVRISGDEYVTVRGEEVRLGDVARIDAAQPDMGQRLSVISLGDAPRPGKSRVIDRGFVLMRISQDGFSSDTVSLNIPEQVEVIRDSRQVSEAEIRKQVEDFFRQRALENAEVQLTDFKLLNEVILPAGDYSLTVEPPARGREMGPVGLNLSFQAQDGYRMKARATAKLEVMTEAVMSVRALERGRLIEAGDIKLAKVSLSSLPVNVSTDPKQVIGKKLKRHIPAMTMLRSELIDEPALVLKGEVVTIYAESGGLRVTALGEAKEDGRGGDQIRITNLDSKKEVHARVLDNRTVQVRY